MKLKSLTELKEKYAQSPSQFIKIGDLDVHYRDEGNPDDELPLVLIHGTCAHLHTFDAWTEVLKKTKRVVRMDLPAFGLTGAFSHHNYSITNYVKFIKDFLETKGIEKCIIGGNSLGGEIAWNFTLEHSERVEKLILIDSAGFELKSKALLFLTKATKVPKFGGVLKHLATKFLVKKSLEEVYGEVTPVKNETVEIYHDLFLREGNPQALVDLGNTLELAIKKIDPKINEISKIQQPTLILWGEKDTLVSLSDAEKFNKNIPNSKLVIFKGAGHVPMEEIPEESVKPVLEFIK
ncbi:alpha/beta hydrolase [Weeksellaceae bacterium TAE3-ERU29]|nr:alpha/beta hydrolase [Weeksellaceae bacterium TAE3-ERU29]